MRILILSFLFLILSVLSFSQENEKDTTLNWDIFDLTLQELMNIEVVSTSKSAQPFRESPGIITLLTENDIKNSGARDLLDLLNLVPGIDFGAEWDGIIGIGIRGNNSTEGKFLLLIDGIRQNETNFGTFPFGQHILLHNIKKIEIVRGPGSVVYGGSAELAVINIITKKGNDLNLVDFSSAVGISNNSLSTYNLQFNYGEELNNGIIYNLSTHYANSNRSNQNLTTLDTTNINYQDSSAIQAFNLNANMNYKSINFQFIYDRYVSNNTEAIGSILFEGIYSSLDYRYQINDKISIFPRVSWIHQKPWYFLDFDEKEFFNSINNRITADVSLNYSINQKLNLFAGAEYFNDRSKKALKQIHFSINDKNHIEFNNYSFFTELFFKSDIINITAGARYENSDKYKASFVPRIAITKAFDKLHFKLLYSNAFKAPTISNIDYNQAINSERTRVYEIETGYQITRNMNVVLNLFDINIQDPILYIPNPITGADYYANFDKTGSRGIEITYKFKPNWGQYNLSYSYYEKNENTVDAYNINSVPKTYGAFPMHKASLISGIKLSNNFHFNATMLFYGNRYTYIHSSKDWQNISLTSFDPCLIINTFLVYNNLLSKRIDLSLGIYDLTNQKFEYLNAYQGGQNPIPSMGREFSFKLNLKI